MKGSHFHQTVLNSNHILNVSASLLDFFPHQFSISLTYTLALLCSTDLREGREKKEKKRQKTIIRLSFKQRGVKLIESKKA